VPCAIRPASSLWSGVSSVSFHLGPDPAQRPFPGALFVTPKMSTHLEILEYLEKMGIDQTLFTAIMAVPNNSMRFLKREEIARFGIDQREFGESSWRFINGSRPKMSKSFFVRVGDEPPRFISGTVTLDCGSDSAIRITVEREGAVSGVLAAQLFSIRIGGRRIELPYPTYLHNSSYTHGSAWLTGRTFDAVADDTEFEIAGIGVPRVDGQETDVTLTMNGFSRAYAMFQPSCNEAPPVHMIHTVPIRPDPTHAPINYGSPSGRRK